MHQAVMIGFKKTTISDTKKIYKQQGDDSMVELNGSNAYKMRYEDGTAEKKKKQQPKVPAKKHIRPNMTVKLNRKKERKQVLARKPAMKKGRTLGDGEIRLLFAGGFAFCVMIAFFAFTMRCNATNNELANILKEKESKLAVLKSDYSSLVVIRDNDLSDEEIEEYAEKNLGMQKKDSHQMKWFEVSWGDDFDD